MDLRKLKTLIDLVSESGISELEVTEGEGKVRIVKNAPPVYVQPSASYAAPQFAPPAPAAAVDAPAGAASAPAARIAGLRTRRTV
ncbi:MAG: acetyl-CoA carboxylase biotin carboxyl carrier protein, partial [Paraburkholderia sp.]